MMAVKERIGKLNKTALMTATLHFFVSFFTDRLIFEYVLFDFSTAKMALRTIETWCVKAVFFLLLIVLWQIAFQCIKSYKVSEAKTDRNPSEELQQTFWKAAIGYMLLMTVLLLLTWPGIWRMDEFGILSSSIQLFPHFWQNYITSVFYILALMLLPFPSGVIIVQCVCISLIVGRIVMLAWNDGGKNRKPITVILLIVPFVMLPVLDSNLYPIRMSLYAFLELWLIAELYFFAKAVRKEKNTDVICVGEKKQLCFLACLAAVVTVWRTEAIYYIVAYPVLLLMIGKGRRYFKQILIYIIITVILFAPQKVGEKLTSGEQYELTSIVLPLVPLVAVASQDSPSVGDNGQLLDVIDKVINVEVTLEGAAQGKSGINLFWGEPDFQRQYTSEQFAQFKSAYYQLVFKYPDVFLKERWQTFVDSSDLLENTTELFTKTEVPNYEVFGTYTLSKPINDKLRTGVIKIIELRNTQDYNQKRAATDMVYSAIPAILVLMAVSLRLLLKRRWTQLVLVLTVLVKVPLIFLTAPSRLFMYYYSVYLIGYCVLFYLLYRMLGGNYESNQ